MRAADYSTTAFIYKQQVSSPFGPPGRDAVKRGSRRFDGLDQGCAATAAAKTVQSGPAGCLCTHCSTVRFSFPRPLAIRTYPSLLCLYSPLILALPGRAYRGSHVLCLAFLFLFPPQESPTNAVLLLNLVTRIRLSLFSFYLFPLLIFLIATRVTRFGAGLLSDYCIQ